MKKAIVSIIAVMFFIFPVMVSATEIADLSDFLDRGHDELRNVFVSNEETTDIEGQDQLNIEEKSLLSGSFNSLADYLPSVTFSVLGSNLKIAGVDVVLVGTILASFITVALISKKNM